MGWMGGWALSLLFPFLGLGPCAKMRLAKAVENKDCGKSLFQTHLHLKVYADQVMY